MARKEVVGALPKLQGQCLNFNLRVVNLVEGYRRLLIEAERRGKSNPYVCIFGNMFIILPASEPCLG
jgi:hypothetical protein